MGAPPILGQREPNIAYLELSEYDTLCMYGYVDPAHMFSSQLEILVSCCSRARPLGLRERLGILNALKGLGSSMH